MSIKKFLKIDDNSKNLFLYDIIVVVNYQQLQPWRLISTLRRCFCLTGRAQDSLNLPLLALHLALCQPPLIIADITKIKTALYKEQLSISLYSNIL